MKRGLLLIAFFFIPLVFAATPYNPSLGSHPLQQLTTDETGTTSADADADGIIDRAETVGSLDGDASLGDGTTNAVLKVKGATTLWSAIDFYSGATNSIWGVGRSKVFGDYRDEDFYIDRSGVRRAFTIDKDTLNVGIDTDNPQYKLDVNGPGRFSGNLVVNGGNVGIGTSNPVYKLDIGASSGNVVNIRGSDGQLYVNNIAPNTGGSLNFNSGNVGIGTTSPPYKLYIVGDVGAQGWIRADGGFQVDGHQIISGDANMIWANRPNSNGGGIWISDDGGLYDYNNGYIDFRGSNGLRLLEWDGSWGDNSIRASRLCIQDDCQTSWPSITSVTMDCYNQYDASICADARYCRTCVNGVCSSYVKTSGGASNCPFDPGGF